MSRYTKKDEECDRFFALGHNTINFYSAAERNNRRDKENRKE
jgi:hypothetical protein